MHAIACTRDRVWPVAQASRGCLRGDPSATGREPRSGGAVFCQGAREPRTDRTLRTRPTRARRAPARLKSKARPIRTISTRPRAVSVTLRVTRGMTDVCAPMHVDVRHRTILCVPACELRSNQLLAANSKSQTHVHHTERLRLSFCVDHLSRLMSDVSRERAPRTPSHPSSPPSARHPTSRRRRPPPARAASSLSL